MMWIEFLAYCAESLAPALGWVGLISLGTGIVLGATPPGAGGR